MMASTTDIDGLVPRRTLRRESASNLPRILMVDDEPAVLTALQRHLRPYFSLSVANGGEEAVEIADRSEPFAVVMTDMRMPGMNGVAVLKYMRENHPDSVRVLLTGYADVESAIAAVNDGNLFRFLTKPSSPDTVRHALSDAVNQHRLILAERELLEGTLRGSVKALLETLSMANPAAFSRATRVKGIVSELLNHVAVEDRWEIEVAAMLSQIGAVTLPTHVVEKLHKGDPLHEDEERMVGQLPALADELLSEIPRIENVRRIITEQQHWRSLNAPIGTKLLQLAIDFDILEARGIPLDVAIRQLKDQEVDYGPEAIRALTEIRSAQGPLRRIEDVAVADLQIGMVLASDLRTRDRMLLVARGAIINEGYLERIRNFSRTVGLETKMVPIVISEESPA